MPETKKLLDTIASVSEPIDIHCPKCGNKYHFNLLEGGFTINNLHTNLYQCGYCGMEFGKGTVVK
jgi:DNA-directed RNA polymerase subunit RPC12/RpoP